ncbi:hypothetical protein PAXINDRAFT_167774 [Paxillus involutus ATCC 200175]|nr:hypothetical protein PAXINDRAFT_167774 [Paxillus involutus ATCC 200175]
MPSSFSSTSSNRLFSIGPPGALLTPSASPSVGPPDRPQPAKRPRLAGTPSSSTSATPSASNDLASPVDVHSARRASTLRVLNVWAQLAERYNKRLDEDDIVDLYSGAIIKDRGVLKGVSKDYNIGHFAQTDDGQEDPEVDQDQEDSEQDAEQDDDEDDELNTLPPRDTDDDPPISKKELLRGVPPLSVTTDAEDLRDFLEAEQRRRDLAGDEENDEDGMSQEELIALRKALEERSRKKEAAAADAADITSTEVPEEKEASATPTRDSTRSLPSDDESEDELGIWSRDESTAVHPIARNESEQGDFEAEQGVIELTEVDSDEEFEAILMRPPRPTRPSPPPPVSPPKQVQRSLQSLPDSRRGRSKSRTRARSKSKSRARSKSKGDPARSPIATPSRSPPAPLSPATPTLRSQSSRSPHRKQQRTAIPPFRRQQSPQLQLLTPPRSSSLIDLPPDIRAPSPLHGQAYPSQQTQLSMSQPQPREKSKPPKLKGNSDIKTSRKLVPEVLIVRRRKSADKEESIVSASDTEEERELADRIPPKDKGKDKEIPRQQGESYRETTFKPLGVTSRGQKRKRLASSTQNGGYHLQESPEHESSFQSHAYSMSRSSAKSPQLIDLSRPPEKHLSAPGQFGSAVPGPSRSFSFSSASTPRQHSPLPAPTYRPSGHGSIPPHPHDYDYNTTPLPHLHRQRHLSHPSPIYPPANRGTPGPLLPGHPPPPIDPLQTQQAHYLLAQAMHQLSYFMSATMPSYGAYTSSPGQPWQHPPSAYGTPAHAPSHDARAYHTPSSSLSQSALPPPSPLQPSVSPPVEEHRARSRARSKSRGRRVSFKLDNEEGSGSQDDDTNAQRHDSEQRLHKQAQESGKGKGKGKTPEVSKNPSRLENRGSPPRRDIPRGRTPGPPCRDECHAPRGRSVSRR